MQAFISKKVFEHFFVTKLLPAKPVKRFLKSC